MGPFTASALDLEATRRSKAKLRGKQDERSNKPNQIRTLQILLAVLVLGLIGVVVALAVVVTENSTNVKIDVEIDSLPPPEPSDNVGGLLNMPPPSPFPSPPPSSLTTYDGGGGDYARDGSDPASLSVAAQAYDHAPEIVAEILASTARHVGNFSLLEVINIHEANYILAQQATASGNEPVAFEASVAIMTASDYMYEHGGNRPPLKPTPGSANGTIAAVAGTGCADGSGHQSVNCDEGSTHTNNATIVVPTSVETVNPHYDGPDTTTTTTNTTFTSNRTAPPGEVVGKSDGNDEV